MIINIMFCRIDQSKANKIAGDVLLQRGSIINMYFTVKIALPVLCFFFFVMLRYVSSKRTGNGKLVRPSLPNLPHLFILFEGRAKFRHRFTMVIIYVNSKTELSIICELLAVGLYMHVLKRKENNSQTMHLSPAFLSIRQMPMK